MIGVQVFVIGRFCQKVFTMKTHLLRAVGVTVCLILSFVILRMGIAYVGSMDDGLCQNTSQ